jgi:FkbM family methyltransferase
MTRQEQIDTIYKCFKKFGVNRHSIRFLMKRKAYLNYKTISFSHRKLPCPIYLRGGGEEANADFTIFDQIFLDGHYAIDFGFQPEVIVDCGANIGFATVFFKSQFPDARVICIEPDASNYEMLCKNTEHLKNITLYQSGLWNKPAHLIIENPFDCNKFGCIVKDVESESAETIQSVTVKQIMEEQDIRLIDILKIDIEGAEKEVFSSDYDYWLSKTRVIIIELHDYIKEGCSKNFFNALLKYDFKIQISGENIICFINHTT